MRLPLLLLLALAPLALAEDYTHVPLRVVSTGPVVVDRGSADGVAVGDRVLLQPRTGGTYGATVVEVDDRSSVIRLDDRSFTPVPGTRGQVSIPESRRPGADEPDPEPEPEPDPVPEPEAEPESEKDPKWENRDEGWKPGMPLLAGGKPVKPEERKRRVLGLVYAIAAVTRNLEDDYTDSYARVGADVTFENPFRRGGRLRVDGELAYLADRTNDQDAKMLLRRLSYAWGGQRFSPTRWEVGRFLQHGMPEFGVLDGVEYGQRRANGHRWGASFGWMPENDDDFETGADIQFAAFYRYVADLGEKVAFTAGFQKTLHNGDADRDLLILKAHVLPEEGWDFFGTVWIDFYTGSDDIKGSGVEVTQAVVTVSRDWADGGVDITFFHFAFPEIDRQGEFIPLLPTELDDARNDRLSIEAWRWLRDQLRLHGRLTGWNDEDESGGAGEVGVEILHAFVDGSRLDLVLFASAAQFEDVIGARAVFGRTFRNRHWEVLYEVSNHRLEGFPDDRDDLLVHRVRASGGARLPNGWDASVWIEGFSFDADLIWSAGFSVQKRF